MYNLHHFLYNILKLKGKILQISYVIGGVKMHKSLIVSLLLIFIGVVIGYLQKDWYLIVDICGMAGLGSLAIAGLLNGAFSGFSNGTAFSSERYKNYPIFDTKENNSIRDQITNFLLIVGVPNIIVAIIAYTLLK